jgi:hypothetical protein
MAEIADIAADMTEKGVEIEHLDYGYIEKCTDAKQLRAILNVLRSGKEGSYPDVRMTVNVCTALKVSPCYILFVSGFAALISLLFQIAHPLVIFTVGV